MARPRVGVLPPVAAIAMAGSLFLLGWDWKELAYFFSPVEPIELGAEGDYHLDRAVSNRYAQLHGVPSARGWYTASAEGDFVVVGVVDTPVLVRRTTFPDEQPLADRRRPQPKQNPFFARGRLLARADAQVYEPVFAEYESWSGQDARWLLLAGQAPRTDVARLAVSGFFLAFAALNGWLLVRGLALRRRR